MAQMLPYIQVVLSLLLIAGVLIQQSEAGLGAGFGGSGETFGRHTRRGLEKLIFRGTIVIAVLFAVSAFASLLLAR
jgi:preprotein translocase subunit SecG